MFIKFTKRIENWNEGTVVREIDVRKLKIEQAKRENKSSKARRLNSELNALSNRLVALRNLELWPDLAAQVSGQPTLQQNAS